MQEDVKPQPGHPRNILFFENVRPWENARLLGEDVQTERHSDGGRAKNSPPVRLGLLAAAGIDAVPCRRQPVVGLVATGSELREANQPLEPGAIYESNRLSLSVLAEQAGAVARVFPLVSDDLAATKFALEQAFALLRCRRDHGRRFGGGDGLGPNRVHGDRRPIGFLERGDADRANLLPSDAAKENFSSACRAIRFRRW